MLSLGKFTFYKDVNMYTDRSPLGQLKRWKRFTSPQLLCWLASIPSSESYSMFVTVSTSDVLIIAENSFWVQDREPWNHITDVLDQYKKCPQRMSDQLRETVKKLWKEMNSPLYQHSAFGLNGPLQSQSLTTLAVKFGALLSEHHFLCMYMWLARWIDIDLWFCRTSRDILHIDFAIYVALFVL